MRMIILSIWESESEVARWCPTLCDPMDYSLPGSSLHGIFQARILEWVDISFSRRSSQPRDWTQVSHIVGKGFTVWANREVRPHGDIAERRAKFYFLSGGSSDAKELSCFGGIFTPTHYFIANAALSTAGVRNRESTCVGLYYKG